MQTRVHAVVLPPDSVEFRDEFRRLFTEIAQASGGSTLTGECSPPLDVYETDETIEISMDLPGVAPTAVRALAKGDAVVIAGQKTPQRGRGDASFHLVERGYGRFARVVRLTSACDASHARATLWDGELRVSIPKRSERRRLPIPITITDLKPTA